MIPLMSNALYLIYFVHGEDGMDITFIKKENIETSA